ncbi:uracil-DNA glycosylase [Oerskovia sp. M15]
MATDLGAPTPRTATCPRGATRGHAAQPGADGRRGRRRSHRRKGWEAITEAAIRALVARDRPLVAILWGRDAATLRPLLGDTPSSSAHPSPLSARRGFFGSRPFSRVDELLVAQGSTPVDWTLPTA